MTTEKRNKLIYERHKEGISQKEIGRLYGLSQSAVSKIIIAAREGVFCLQKETRGSKPRLSKNDKMKLVQYMRIKKATDYGFAADLWTKWSLQAMITDVFGVHYHENYIWSIMKELGFSSQKPILKDYGKDAKKVKAFKVKRARYIKKS